MARISEDTPESSTPRSFRKAFASSGERSISSDSIRALIGTKMLKGAAHITGGGITGNLPRILPEGLAARIDVSSWTVPPIFERLREIGNIDPADYRRTFNLGIGMILVVAKRNIPKTRATLALLGEPCPEIGEVIEGRGDRVVYVGDAGARR